MKRLHAGGIYEFGLLSVLLLIVVHAPIAVGLGSLLPDYAVPIKAWKELLLALMSLLALSLITTRRLWPVLLRDRIVLACLAFLTLHAMFGLLFRTDINSLVAGLLIDGRFIVMFLLLYVLVLLRPQARRRALLVTAVGAAIVIGFGLLQITVLPRDILTHIGYSTDTIAPYTTIDSNPAFTRINSTLRGPNPLGALMLVYLALALSFLYRRHRLAPIQQRLLTIAACVGSAILVAVSYSRSAYIGAVITIFTIIARYKRPSRRTLVLSVIVAAGLTVGLFVVSSSDIYSNIVLHEDPESTVTAKSNDGHIASLIDGAQRIATHPFGSGIGSTGSASLYDASTANDTVIENYYFFVAHETGWLGLLIFIVIVWLVLQRLWLARRDWFSLALFASGLGLTVVALLLPVWADDTVSLIWWGLAGSALASQHAILRSNHAA